MFCIDLTLKNFSQNGCGSQKMYLLFVGHKIGGCEAYKQQVFDLAGIAHHHVHP